MGFTKVKIFNIDHVSKLLNTWNVLFFKILTSDKIWISENPVKKPNNFKNVLLLFVILQEVTSARQHSPTLKKEKLINNLNEK